MTRNDVEVTLKALIKRYLGTSNQSLAAWLLSRADDEYIVEIRPAWITSWDYGNRMENT